MSLPISTIVYERCSGCFPLNRFVCAHLAAHERKLAHRLADYNHIVGSLVFPPPPTYPSSSGKPSTTPTTIYDTSHLFFFGDLNFRLDLPVTHPLHGSDNYHELISALDSESKREELKEYDQLRVELKKGTTFVGLREGEFWKFKVSLPRCIGLRSACDSPMFRSAVHVQVRDWRSRQIQVDAKTSHILKLCSPRSRKHSQGTILDRQGVVRYVFRRSRDPGEVEHYKPFVYLCPGIYYF